MCTTVVGLNYHSAIRFDFRAITFKCQICFDTHLHAGAVVLFAACALRIHYPMLSFVMHEQVHVHI